MTSIKDYSPLKLLIWVSKHQVNHSFTLIHIFYIPSHTSLYDYNLGSLSKLKNDVWGTVLTLYYIK